MSVKVSVLLSNTTAMIFQPPCSRNGRYHRNSHVLVSVSFLISTFQTYRYVEEVPFVCHLSQTVRECADCIAMFINHYIPHMMNSFSTLLFHHPWSHTSLDQRFQYYVNAAKQDRNNSVHGSYHAQHSWIWLTRYTRPKQWRLSYQHGQGLHTLPR